MTFPFHIVIGNGQIPLHAFFETAAFFIGFRYYLYLRRKEVDHISTGNRTWIIIGAIFGALAGSRLLGALENPAEWWQSPNHLLYLYQNKTVVGGFLGGLMGVELTKKIIHEPHSSGDLFTYPMIMALIIGRIGCFSMGVYEETYGIHSHLPWAMDLGDGITRHPVAIYEIIYLLITSYVLHTIRANNGLKNGALFKLFMIAYLGFRFALEFIKPHVSVLAGLSSIQLACLGGLIYYAPYLIKPNKLLQSYA